MKRRFQVLLAMALQVLIIYLGRFNVIISPQNLQREETVITTGSASLEDGSSNPKHVDGTASWYGEEYCRRWNPRCNMANGEIFNENAYTAACADHYPLGTTLLVSYEMVSVTVRCTDRGSFEEKYGRTLDLSKAAFEQLAPLSKGVIKIRIWEEK